MPTKTLLEVSGAEACVCVFSLVFLSNCCLVNYVFTKALPPKGALFGLGAATQPFFLINSQSIRSLAFRASLPLILKFIRVSSKAFFVVGQS